MARFRNRHPNPGSQRKKETVGSVSDSDIVAVDSDVDVEYLDHDDVSNYNPEQILPQEPEVIEDIRSWLQPTSYDIAGGEYRKHLDSHVAGTGAWLTSSSTYQEWLQSTENGLLWIKGIPGSGKSVMAANLIDEIAKANPGCPVLYFFFRQIIEANHQPEALLRDWLDQILIYSPPLQLKLKDDVERRRALGSLSMEDLWRYLRLAFAGLPGKVFCVADALDEMDRGNDSFLKSLAALGKWRPEKVKVLITSRPVPSVEIPLRNMPALHLRLEENLVDVDIATYVQYALSRSEIPQSEWKTIADAVPGQANGLFLYAKLAMDAFLAPGANVKEVLSQLPADLNVLYTDLLKEHAQRSKVPASVQHLILEAVTHAARPLRLLELAEMIKINSPDGSTRSLKDTKNLIRAACGPLLEILADETVSVIHHSFTEYLKGTTRSDDGTGYPILQMGPTHTQLAIACLRYLKAGCLDGLDVPKDPLDDVSDCSSTYGTESNLTHREVATLRLRHPFFDYAISNWAHHINRAESAGHDQSEVNGELRKFLGEEQSMKAWCRVKWSGVKGHAHDFTQLHVAAERGLISYTKELVGTMEVDAADLQGRTPLWWAAQSGHGEIIRVLVAAGANPDRDEHRTGLKPLHQAASYNREDAVRALLEAGVNPLTIKTKEAPGPRCGNAPRTVGHTPLMYAARNGHLEAVEAFIPFLKDIKTVHRTLAWAAKKGRSKVVARILEYPGVDVNAKIDGCTPLYQACSSCDVKTIEVLLKAGADPNIHCEDDGDEFSRMGRLRLPSDKSPALSCLHQLCSQATQKRQWHEVEPADFHAMFTLLVEAGADIHHRTGMGDTALHAAVGSPILTRLLLDAGADANVVDCDGRTPLHKCRCVETMVLLVEQGHADINVMADNRQTPILVVLSGYQLDTMLKFLEYGPDCNVIDSKGNGVLHIALRQSRTEPELTEALLKAGADPNLRNGDGDAPLHIIGRMMDGFDGIVELLIGAGADIEAPDREGLTPLMRTVALPHHAYLSEHDEHKNVKSLLSRGASLEARDFHGRTCLHEAVKKADTRLARQENSVERVDFLISIGMDPKVVDYRGNGLLHECALRPENHDPYHGSWGVVSWESYIALGLDLEQKNHAGRTPLHIVCSANNPMRQIRQGEFMPIDYVIRETKNLDAVDNDGVTPLHIAVTGGTLYAKKLLDAGADPTIATHEGLTPLHIAARCRESNAVGLLLDALRERQKSTAAKDKSQPTSDTPAKPSSEPVMGVNAQAFGKASHITPLYYACRSGRPETVALLLEAGADVHIGRIFEACVEFEEEETIWKIPHTSVDDGSGGAVALKLNDKARRTNGIRSNRSSSEFSSHESPRLEEILDMLVEYGADLGQLDNQLVRQSWKSGCIEQAAEANRAYTAACLRDLKEKNNHHVSQPERLSTTFSARMAESIREASAQTLQEFNPLQPGKSNQHLFTPLLSRREYRLVEQLAAQGVTFLPHPDEDNISNMVILIRNGFDRLLDRIGTQEAEKHLEEGAWHAFGDKSRPGLHLSNRNLEDSRGSRHKGQNPLPFLQEAVARDLPNMEVVRLLVEKFAVDVNELHCYHEVHAGVYQVVPKTSAIHSVARGTSWWQVHQALPYLIKAGADVNVRNYLGLTPLHVALKGDGNWPGSFNKDAARILVEAGADVDAVDGKGMSCLACAGHDIDMIRLLTQHGATVKADGILTAINVGNVAVLEALLSGGVDPNIRLEKPSEDEDPSTTHYELVRRTITTSLEPHEVFPLYHAAINASRPRRDIWGKHREKLERSIEIIEILLEHGADPFAKMLEHKVPMDLKDPATSLQTPTIEVPDGDQECTLVHDVFFHSRMPEPFLNHPGLDVEHRDARGRTLLLAACLGGPDFITEQYHGRKVIDESLHISLFERLLLMGADIEARDHFGRNVLHHMIEDHYGKDLSEFEVSLAKVLKTNPGLINQTDGEGKTPLHYAIRRAAQRRDSGVANQLLEYGADPLAITKNGDTMLHILAQNLEVQQLRTLFQELVNRGIDVNARNVQGESMLFAFAARTKRDPEPVYRRHIDMEQQEMLTEEDVRPMFEKMGADFFVRDARERGLLHVAARGDVGRFKELMDLGLDVMLEDEAQQTAIDVAAACSNKDVLELFEKKI